MLVLVFELAAALKSAPQLSILIVRSMKTNQPFFPSTHHRHLFVVNPPQKQTNPPKTQHYRILSLRSKLNYRISVAPGKPTMTLFIHYIHKGEFTVIHKMVLCNNG